MSENSTMEIDQQNEDLNNWLPVTASRKAKWWYSAFHNVTAMVGAGVLGLPFAISQLGWYIFFCSKTHNPSSSFFFLHLILSIIGRELKLFVRNSNRNILGLKDY